MYVSTGLTFLPVDDREGLMRVAESRRSQGLHAIQLILGSGRHISAVRSESQTPVQNKAKNLGVDLNWNQRE